MILPPRKGDGSVNVLKQIWNNYQEWADNHPGPEWSRGRKGGNIFRLISYLTALAIVAETVYLIVTVGYSHSTWITAIIGITFVVALGKWIPGQAEKWERERLERISKRNK